MAGEGIQELPVDNRQIDARSIVTLIVFFVVSKSGSAVFPDGKKSTAAASAAGRGNGSYREGQA